jgi:hypothetical protein
LLKKSDSNGKPLILNIFRSSAGSGWLESSRGRTEPPGENQVFEIRTNMVSYSTPPPNAIPSKCDPGDFRLILRNNFNSIIYNIQAQAGIMPADNMLEAAPSIGFRQI